VRLETTMSTNRSAEMMWLVLHTAEDFYTKHGHYPSRVRVGPLVSRSLLKDGQCSARIALRPGTTTLWITVVAAAELGARAVIAES